MQNELETFVGHVNGKFGTVDWVPLHYIHRCHSHSQIASFYRFSEVGLVTSLCDGMNLVAKEYVAAQDPASPGVLLLSRFTGAAEQMTDALLVNPYDRAETARTLKTAITMPLNERKSRWTRLMEGLKRQDVHEWRRSFLAALAQTQNRGASSDGPTASAA
jgi:trehalose 6-phosphate synthase